MYLLATNANGNRCSAAYAISLSNSVSFFMGEDLPVLNPIIFDGFLNPAMAFNQVLTWAYKNEAEGLFLVGCELGWDPQTLKTLIDSDKGVVGAPVSYNGHYRLSLGEMSRLQTDENSGEILVKDASMDFLFIRGNAIKDVCEANPTVNFNGEEVKMVIQSGDIYTSYHSNEEILAFRLQEVGYQTWVNPALKIRSTVYSMGESNLAADLAAQLKDE